MPYTADSPARDVQKLVAYLGERSDAGAYLYRGQNREYSGPLLPSLYRGYKSTGATYTQEDREFQWSIYGRASRFCGLDPVAGWLGVPASRFDKISDKRFNDVVSMAVETLIMDPQADVAAASGSIQTLLNTKLGPQGDGLIENLEPVMADMLDSLHRRYIRDIVFSIPLGLLLGNTVAQQYGFNSAFLDVTTSPAVAGFFAAHTAPKFQVSPDGSQPGVIYRFPREPEKYITKLDAMISSVRAFPQGVVIRDLVAPFECPNSDFGKVLKDYVEYALDALETADPVWEELSFPQGWLEFSRMGRQDAAVLIPDRIVNPMSERLEPLALGAASFVPILFAVEDLSTRPGVEKYYFRHAERTPEDMDITREYLWPRDADFFLMVTKSLLMIGPSVAYYQHTGYPHTHVPMRADLVDGGYDSNE